MDTRLVFGEAGRHINQVYRLKKTSSNPNKSPQYVLRVFDEKVLCDADDLMTVKGCTADGEIFPVRSSENLVVSTALYELMPSK